MRSCVTPITKRFAVIAATLFALVVAPREVRAQAQSDALLDRFQPPPPGEYFAGLPFPRYNGDYYVVMRAGATLRATGSHIANTAPNDARINTQLMLHPLVFFGVHNSVAVYAGLPVMLQNFGGPGVERVGRAGDPRIGTRVRILNEAARSAWSIHLAGELFLPAFWLNGVPAEHFTGASDGTVRGNLGLIGAGSFGIDSVPRPPAIGNRFLWSAIVEENIRPAATDVRPGPETHAAGGIGFLIPNDGHGVRFTVEGHSFWRWDRITQGWPGVTVEGVFGAAVRLPAEFEIVGSFSVGTAWRGDVVVRDGPVLGGTIGIAYAIRDWAGFPLAYDNGGNVPDPRPLPFQAFACQPDPDRTRPANHREDCDWDWDRDRDGLDDREDACDSRSACSLDQLERERVARERHRLETVMVSGLRLPVTLGHPLVVEAPEHMHDDLIFHSAADLAQLARTVESEKEQLRMLRDAVIAAMSGSFGGVIATGLAGAASNDDVTFPFEPGVLTVYVTADLQFAGRLHPALRTSTSLRRVWVMLQFERALRRAGAHFDHVDSLEPTPCRESEPVDRVCIYASVRTDGVRRSDAMQREIDQLEEQGIP